MNSRYGRSGCRQKFRNNPKQRGSTLSKKNYVSHEQMDSIANQFDLIFTSEQQSLSYDQSLLGKSVTQWQFGDWQSLAKLEHAKISSHPNRERLALLIAAAHFQLGNLDSGKEFIYLARDWGCNNELILQILISGAHNTLGIAANMLERNDKSQLHFEKSIQIGAPYTDASLVAEVRKMQQLSCIIVNAKENMTASKLSNAHSDCSLMSKLKLQNQTEQSTTSGRNSNSFRELTLFSDNKNDWVAVITVYKREKYLEEQLNAIQNQSLPPTKIVIIQNEKHFEIDKNILIKFNIELITSSINSLYTRWIISYLFNSEYVCVFDDDVIPGVKWIENCIRASRQHNALVTCTGRIINVSGNTPNCWNVLYSIIKDGVVKNGIVEDTICDWGCNSYFFRTEWIKYIVSSSRYLNYQLTFDDIQLATNLKFFGNIKTVVPKQPVNDISLHGQLKREYGTDDDALSNILVNPKNEHYILRNNFLKKIDSSDFVWNSKDRV